MPHPHDISDLISRACGPTAGGPERDEALRERIMRRIPAYPPIASWPLRAGVVRGIFASLAAACIWMQAHLLAGAIAGHLVLIIAAFAAATWAAIASRAIIAESPRAARRRGRIDLVGAGCTLAAVGIIGVCV